jgi:hypothetical protein
MHCVWCWVPWAWVGYLVHSVEGTPFVLPYYIRGHQHHLARKPWVACTLLQSGTRTTSTTTTTTKLLVNESWKLGATTTCICSLLGFFFFWWVIGLDGALYQVFLVNQSRGVKPTIVDGFWGMGFFFPTSLSLGRQLIFLI